MGNMTALEGKPNPDAFRLPPLEANTVQTVSEETVQKAPPPAQIRPQPPRESMNTTIFSKFLLPRPSATGTTPQKQAGWLETHLTRLVFRLELSRHLKATFRGRVYFGWADRSSMFLTPALLAPVFVFGRYRLKLSRMRSVVLSLYFCATYFIYCGYFLTEKEFFSWMCKDHPLAEFGRRQYLVRFGGDAEAWGQTFSQIERERLLLNTATSNPPPRK